MLVGEGSCWWRSEFIFYCFASAAASSEGRIVEKNHVGGGVSCWFCKMMNSATILFEFSVPKMRLIHRTGPGVSVLRKTNRSKL